MQHIMDNLSKLLSKVISDRGTDVGKDHKSYCTSKPLYSILLNY